MCTRPEFSISTMVFMCLEMSSRSTTLTMGSSVDLSRQCITRSISSLILASTFLIPAVQAEDHQHLAGVSDGAPATDDKTKRIGKLPPEFLISTGILGLLEQSQSLSSPSDRAVELCSCVPVDHLSLPLTGDHVQERLPQVVSDAAVAHHLVSEDDEAQVVHVLHIVLLNVHTVLGNERERRGRQAVEAESCE
ncbi:hypothetical protein EYF80_055537 [Liparis tanakae]|uniref:Uncharacterized protein n=1 Tax=Liparis tanakae TaxID=230148 RepID=A0A4Z2F027_9TELE|nr:hypothetical protein EYF80_055537 [Liparis tanakae]